jgi:hypothetical protein
LPRTDPEISRVAKGESHAGFHHVGFHHSASLAALLIPLGLGLALPASAQQASVDREVLPIAQPPSAGIVNRTLAGSGREICDSSSIGLNSQTRQISFISQSRSVTPAARAGVVRSVLSNEIDIAAKRRACPPRQCGMPPMASRLLFAHPLESRAGVVGRHSCLLGGLLRRAALGVEPRPYARRDRGRLDAVPALQLDLSTVLPLGIARGWRCRSSCATALAWHVPILS